MRPLSIAVPKKGSDRWLYEILRHLQLGVQSSQSGLNAIVRGEVPDGSGTPLPNPDLTGYFKLIGRADDQIGYGSIDASGALTFGSTSHATKGFIYIGTAANDRIAFDETTKLVGLNTDTPASTLHIVGSDLGAGAALLPNSNQNPGPPGWADPVIGYSGTPSGETHFAAVNNNDDPPGSSILINAGGSSSSAVGVNPETLGLDTTVIAGQSYSILTRVWVLSFPTGPNPLDATTSFLGVSLIDSAGNEWTSAANAGINNVNSPLVDLVLAANTQYYRTFTVNCTGTPYQTGQTPNCVRIYMGATINSGATGVYTAVNYIEITTLGSSLVRWDLSSGTRSGQIDGFGRVGVGTGSTDLDAMLTTFCRSAATLGLRVKAAASQTADLVRFTNSAGTALSGFTATGDPYLIAHAALDAVLVSDASGVGAWKELVAWEDEILFYEDSPVYFQ